MTPLAIALALFAQDLPDLATTPAAEPVPAAAPAATPPEDRLPTGAPKDDYPFVAWCYGSLRGYLDMHDEMMPEVTRIERQFRKPGTKLEDDLKVYADMQRDGREKLKLFQSALTAAEKASVQPLNIQGAAAVRQGRMSWNTGPDVTKARKAQEWMSWALPARCEKVAAQLETRSRLLGATLKANAPTEAPPVADAPAPEATSEAAPEPAAPADTPAADASPSPAD